VLLPSPKFEGEVAGSDDLPGTALRNEAQNRVNNLQLLAIKRSEGRIRIIAEETAGLSFIGHRSLGSSALRRDRPR
jgi:hypothetical protein